jgi:hypothetical protein
VDVRTRTPGLAFEDAWRNRETMVFRGQSFHVVSRSDLVAAKKAARHPVDLEDVRLLEGGGATNR